MSTSTEPKISVACPHCGKLLKAPPAWIGKNLKCPGCGKTFTAKKSAPSPAAGMPSTRGPQVEFVEDRKGKAEFKAMMLGFGCSLGAAAIAIGIWYAIGHSTKGDARWFSLLVGPMVGIPMYLGYRRADVMMGFLTAAIALGTIVFGRYVMYSAMADELAGELVVTELAGPKAVAFQDKFEEEEMKLPEYSEEEDPEGDKHQADRAALRARLIKEIGQLPEESVRKQILEIDYRQIDGYVAEAAYTKAINDSGYAPDTAPGYVSENASRTADEAVKKMTAAEKKAKYLDARTRELREELPKKMAELDIARSGREAPGGPDPTLIAAKKKQIETMKVDDMIIEDHIVDAEQWQLSLAQLKDTGAKVATGLSFFSPRQLWMTLFSCGLAFTFATGGKFKE